MKKMEDSMIDTVIFVDYENIQDLRIDDLDKDTKLVIVTGMDQNKIPFELVQQTQKFGDTIEWVKVSGKGKNALDFFISYFLGKYIEQGAYSDYIILSKDRGYDPLIQYLRYHNKKVRRIVNFQELQKNGVRTSEEDILKVKENLGRIIPSKRPKKRNSLEGHIKTIFGNSKTTDEISQITEDLFIKNILFEENGLIKYSLVAKV